METRPRGWRAPGSPSPSVSHYVRERGEVRPQRGQLLDGAEASGGRHGKSDTVCALSTGHSDSLPAAALPKRRLP